MYVLWIASTCNPRKGNVTNRYDKCSRCKCQTARMFNYWRNVIAFRQTYFAEWEKFNQAA